MTITVDFAPWMIPAVLTVVFFMAAIMWPTKKQSDLAGFLSDAFAGAARMILAIFGSLLAWLVYFIIY